MTYSKNRTQISYHHAIPLNRHSGAGQNPDLLKLYVCNFWNLAKHDCWLDSGLRQNDDVGNGKNNEKFTIATLIWVGGVDFGVAFGVGFDVDSHSPATAPVMI